MPFSNHRKRRRTATADKTLTIGQKKAHKHYGNLARPQTKKRVDYRMTLNYDLETETKRGTEKQISKAV
jgi:hypothetical protein